MTDLPYRPNVAAMIFNAKGQILIALRHDLAKEEVWSLPQGGIDKNETPQAAIKRELLEEIGSDKISILDEYPEWLTYDLPAHLIGKAFKGKYKGQTQKWFAVRFLGEDTDINLDAYEEKEFDEWKWVSLAELATINTGFKHDLYLKVATHFKKYATP